MRLIDVDALLENEENFVSSTWGLAIAISDIDEADVVDAEPVRHGWWEPMRVSSGRNSWRCSECGRRARGKRENLPYCHCGTKMDLEARGESSPAIPLKGR